MATYRKSNLPFNTTPVSRPIPTQTPYPPVYQSPQNLPQQNLPQPIYTIEEKPGFFNRKIKVSTALLISAISALVGGLGYYAYTEYRRNNPPRE